MAGLGVLTNISAIYAENNLNQTQASLQNTLTQLSSGSRINSGSDDAAGLAVVDGLQANEAALTQSASNATDGVGLLQTADGALSQVNSLLNRAVTLATETANGTLNSSQISSANAEYQNILSEITDIGNTTNFNGNSVFSNSATSLFVSDGTSSGANNYNVEVGALTDSSIGQTQNTTITSSAIAPTVTAPTSALANSAGIYTLAPTVSSDTLSGTFSFSVGTSGTPTNITVAAGTTQAQLAAQLNANSAFTAAGLSASINTTSNDLQITGPTSGANAIANTVSFTGTSLVDSSTGTTVTPALSPSVVAPVAAVTTTTINATTVAATDTIASGGTVQISFNGASIGTYTSTANQTLTSFIAALNSQFAADGVTVTAGGSAATIKFTGTNGDASALTVNATFTDSTAAGFTNTTSAVTTAGVAPVAPVQTLGLGSNTDVFSTNLAITEQGQSAVTVSTTGLTGAQAAAAINANSTLQGYGVSASWNATTNKLAITGNPSGNDTLLVAGAGGATIYDDKVLTTVATTSAAQGVAAAGGSLAITLGSAADTVGGNLNVTIGTSGLAKDSLNLTVAAGTTGQDLANQINENTAFETAGVTASYNSTNFTVTLSGPAGLTNTLTDSTTTGGVTTTTALTDTTNAYASAGQTLAGSSLTSTSSAAVLSQVTSAIQDVAYQRGILGADVNQLTAAANVANSESENLTSASSSLDQTDYGAATSNLAKYQVLSQTGIAALAQANSVSQEILKLLQ